MGATTKAATVTAATEEAAALGTVEAAAEATTAQQWPTKAK